MTSQDSPIPPRKQRLGAPPIQDQQTVTAEETLAEKETISAPEPSISAAGISEGHANTQKTRMAVGTAPSAQSETPRRTRLGAATTAAPAATTAMNAPQSRTRIGGGVSATGSSAEGTPAQRTRMGAGTAPAGGTVSPVRVVGTPVTESPTTRMGSTHDSTAHPNGARSAAARSNSANPSTGRLRTAISATIAAIPLKNSKINWKRALLIVGAILFLVAAMVVMARWLRTLPDVQAFIGTYPGNATLPETAPIGLPAWMGWQHFFNMFFMVLIVRTGLLVRHEKKVPAYVTPKAGSFFSPKGSTPKKISLSQWLHQALDVLWVANGLVFVVLLFVSSQWMKIVPTSWDVFPNAVSAALQYASLNWPHENGWIHYNALQMIAYFLTVFVAAPLAVLSGVRFSSWWPDQNQKLSRLYPVEVARAIHYPVMLYFVVFTLVHVFLVFFTGALKNLNHMYTSRDVADAWGLGIFLFSLLVIIAGWFLTKPLFMRPIASKFGTLSK